METTITGATHVIINVSGDITLNDASEASDYVRELTGDEVNVIFGAMYDETKQDTCTITVIATGLEAPAEKNAAKPGFGSYGNGGRFIQPSSYQVNGQEAARKPVVMAPGNTGAIPNVNQALSGIQKPPTDLRSNVATKSLKIPDFLQRNK